MVSLYAVQWSSISLSPSVNLDRSFKLSQQRFAVRLEGKSRILVCLGLGRAAAGSAGISEKSGLGATSKEVIELERKVVVQTYARAPLVLVRGKGCKVYDAEGQEYLDMGAGIAVNSMGHGDPDLLKAIGEATELIHVSNVYYTIPQVELGKCLVECSFADRVFFSNSGTEANEAAIKFSRKFQRFYWPDVKLPAMEFIAFTNSFHGRTMGSLALTSKKNYRSPFEPVMPGVTFIEYGNIEMARNAIQPGKTAAVFVEPVQGEGGIYCAGKEFLQALRIACDDAGALLIFDEAAEECTSVLELDHNHTGALMLRAQTLVTLKEYQSALFDVNRLMELNPSSDVYLNLQSRLKTQLALTPIPESEEEALAAELEEEEEEMEAVLEETVEAELEDEEVEGEAEEVAIVAEVDKNKKIMSPGNNPELLVDHTSEDLSDMHPQGWEAVPKPKGHSRLDYSRWDKVEDDSSEEEDEAEDSQPQYRFRLKTVGVRPVK